MFLDEYMVVCKSILNGDWYDLKYDKLVIGVGVVSNIFGVLGVYDYVFFFKEILDVRMIRN